MRIAIDATAILGPMSRNRGIGNYTMGLFPKMIDIDENNSYLFFNLYDTNFDLCQYVNNQSNLEEMKLYMGHDNFLMKKDFEKLHEGIIKKYISENNIDVFFVTSPFDNNSIVYKREWFGDCKVVMLVYDIIPYVMKNHYFPHGAGMDWYMERIEMIRWADQIQVISQSVKDDLVKYLDFDADKIKVIWGAVDSRFKEIDISEDDKRELFAKFGINSKYIMCTGGDDERKNIASLIRAYSMLDDALKKEYQLAIVCKLSASAVERYTDLIKKVNCVGRVVLTNFVTDDELVALYNLASLMAFPSKYEGFGLPVVEAWACGTNVLTSNNSSLVQIAGDAAVIVDANSEDDIKNGLYSALVENDMELLLQKGKERLKLYQWDVVAASSIGFINDIDLCKEEQSVNRKKIAMFTPLPPLQSGIADYSLDIVNALVNYVDIDVYIDSGYKVECEIDDRIRVFAHKEFEKNRNDYQEIVYQMGNSDFHSYMFEYVKKYEGIVVLHDYNLHGIANYYSLNKGKKDFKRYREILVEDWDEEIVNNYISGIKNGSEGYRIYDMPVNGFVTNYAKKIIVHSFEAKHKLLSKNFGRNVRQIWHYAKPAQNLEDSINLKTKFGYEKSDIIVAAFGHVHETKRTIPIVEAFSKIAKEYLNVKLVFVGKLDNSIKGDFKQKVRELQIEDKVRVTGYTDISDFVDYISITDICMNLRYPYNGETSGSLMRIFAQGKSVVVNDIGSFGEFPSNTCIKLPSVEKMTSAEEVNQIENAIRSLIDDESKRKELQKEAWSFAKDNLDINKIARDYYEYINEDDRRYISEEMLKQIVELSSSVAEIDRIEKTMEYLI